LIGVVQYLLVITEKHNSVDQPKAKRTLAFY